MKPPTSVKNEQNCKCLRKTCIVKNYFKKKILEYLLWPKKQVLYEVEQFWFSRLRVIIGTTQLQQHIIIYR